jgi:hypothetical protein
MPIHRAPNRRAWLRPLAAGVLLGAVLSPALQSVAEQTYTWGEQYRSIPARYQRLIDDSELAFTKRDADASAASLTDDFSWYTFNDAGPAEMVRGKEATRARLQSFFASPLWTDNNSIVHRLGMVDNILVQVEIDNLNTDKGPVAKTSLHVYEFRNGLRYRETVFYPLPDAPAGAVPGK